MHMPESGMIYYLVNVKHGLRAGATQPVILGV